MIKLDPNFISGLVEGDGTFTYSRTPQTNTINLFFAIKLNIKDADLLKKVWDYFGVGKIYYVESAPKRQFSKPDYISRATAYYRVTKLAELFKIIRHFDQYPLHGHKAKAFIIWKKMVNYKKLMYRSDMPKMLALAAELSKANGPGGRGKPLLSRDSNLVPKEPIPPVQYDPNSRHYDTTA